MLVAKQLRSENSFGVCEWAAAPARRARRCLVGGRNRPQHGFLSGGAQVAQGATTRFLKFLKHVPLGFHSSTDGMNETSCRWP